MNHLLKLKCDSFIFVYFLLFINWFYWIWCNYKSVNWISMMSAELQNQSQSSTFFWNLKCTVLLAAKRWIIIMWKRPNDICLRIVGQIFLWNKRKEKKNTSRFEKTIKTWNENLRSFFLQQCSAKDMNYTRMKWSKYEEMWKLILSWLQV